VAEEHLPTILKRVNDHGPGISQPDLKHGVAVLAPPFLAHGGMVVSEFEEMAEDRYGTGDFG
jgi:hypothetical protein